MIIPPLLAWYWRHSLIHWLKLTSICSSLIKSNVVKKIYWLKFISPVILLIDKKQTGVWFNVWKQLYDLIHCNMCLLELLSFPYYFMPLESFSTYFRTNDSLNIETSNLICTKSELIGFYMRGALISKLVLNGFRKPCKIPRVTQKFGKLNSLSFPT